jgi:hypothetical protein
MADFNYTGPKMPGPMNPNDLKVNVNADNYKTNIPSLADVQKEFGLQDPAKYAETLANANAQGKLDGIESQRKNIDQNLREGQMAMDVDFFHQFRNQKEAQAQRGLNAGIEAQQNTQLDMNRQSVLGDLYRDANRQNNDLDTDSRRVEIERQAEELQIQHNELQSQIDIAFRKGDFLQAENARRMQLDVEKEKARIDSVHKKWQTDFDTYQASYGNQWGAYVQDMTAGFERQRIGLEERRIASQDRIANAELALSRQRLASESADRAADRSLRQSEINSAKAAEAKSIQQASTKMVSDAVIAARTNGKDIGNTMRSLNNARIDGLLSDAAYKSAVVKVNDAYTTSKYYKDQYKKKFG